MALSNRVNGPTSVLISRGYELPTSFNLILKSFVQTARLVSKRRTLRERYDEYRTAFDRRPTAETAKALEELIGTTTSIDEVFAAMDAEFDSKHYLAMNPDVRSSGIDASFHYLFWGWKENRTPSKFFDPAYYAKKNRDIEEQEFPLAHYLKNGRAKGLPANPVGDQIWFQPFVPSDTDWLQVRPALRKHNTRTVVIIPVYKGYKETLSSIFCALSSRYDEMYSLLVINDKSPEEDISTKLSELSRMGLFDYYQSHINRGFSKTINDSLLNLTGNLDAIVLHSDAYVFPGWFGRLVKYADCDSTIATITPLSNNSSICSYPIYDSDNCLNLELSPETLDQLAIGANFGLCAEAPTGYGFCLYMRRAAIDKIGLLDTETFNDGYGVVDDWCTRAINAGMKNIIAGDVFVYHTGAVSLSCAAFNEEGVANGQRNLTRKHPHHMMLQTRHKQADPERPFRRNLDAQRLVRSHHGAILFITHRWGGGIETYLRYRQEKLKSEGKQCLILRVHDDHCVTFEDPADRAIFVPNLAEIDLRSEADFIAELITELSPALLHVNSLAGLNWPFQRQVLELLSRFDFPTTFVGHDFSPITHHYQLLRPDNVFVGVPSMEALKTWNSMKGNSDKPDACDPKERSQVYTAFFQSGVRVEVPSHTTREIYSNIFPSIHIEVVPHGDHLPECLRAVRGPASAKLRVVIVGAIGAHKGSDVIAALADEAKNKTLPIEYHLLGYSDDEDRLRSADVKIWGRYSSDEEALTKLDEIQPDVCLIPSIWPETFCYTLSLALKKGIPPVVFDLGAQAERIKEITWAAALSVELANNPARLSEELLSLPIDAMWANAQSGDRASTYP